MLPGTGYRPGSGDLPGQGVYGESDPDGPEKGIREDDVIVATKARILLKLKTMKLRVTTMDKFNKAAHPRGGDPENRGRFSKSLGSKNKLIDKRKNDTLKRDRHVKRQHATIRLSPKEYAEVVSALNTNLTKEKMVAESCGKLLLYL